MSRPFLEVRNVSKSFAGVRALENVSLTINQGEIRCLVGENGSGKSTLIKIIAGVYAPDHGDIIIGGKLFKRLHPIDSIREGIQIIYQDFSLFPNLTVAENLALNHEMSQRRRFVDWRGVNQIAREALARIGVEIPLNARVEELPVADKQLVAISRALLQHARLIIMDEPTTALTRREVDALFRVIKGLQQKGISILFVSHKLNEVYEIAEKITILRNGKNVADGDTSEFDRAKLIYHMTGRQVEQSRYEREAGGDQARPLLKVENLSRRGEYSDVSFELYPGEILGLVGLLGAGRTELAMSLLGLRPPDSGRIYIDGKPIKIRSFEQAVKQGIGYVPEDRLTQGLFLQQSIGRNIVVGTIDRYLNRFGLIDSRKVNGQISKWVRDLSIVTPSPLLPVQSLSGGNQQRVVLAKWLASNPRILVLNGPTVGVDVGSKAEIHRIIRELARQGVGVLLISDDIPEVLNNCSRILLMRKGRIVEEFTAGMVSENELVNKLSGAA
ncbi:MAG TPA: sugar ABC transporter ATP-binding protein [Firmicutes bacterium]|nr:sugar ABC transporter ATP-binding protein [Bacillota bacterium]